MNTVISNNKQQRNRHKYFNRPPLPEIGRDALPYLEWCEYRQSVNRKIAFFGILILGALFLMFL